MNVLFACVAPQVTFGTRTASTHHNHRKLSRVTCDGVTEFCVCERVEEEYLRVVIDRAYPLIGRSEKANVQRIGGTIGMERLRQLIWAEVMLKDRQNVPFDDQPSVPINKGVSFLGMVLLLFGFQRVLGSIGGCIANLFRCDKFDPYKAYAWVTVHHLIVMAVALAAMLILGKLLKSDFGLGLGDRKKGIKYVWVYTAVFAGISLVLHFLMFVNKALPVYDFPLTLGNVLGTLGFQLLLSGPAEELLYRALPITLLVFALGKSGSVQPSITLETTIAAILFALAHMTLSIFPFSIEANPFQVCYALGQGIILGKAYQESRSVIYPMFMHSISNVLMVGMGYLFLLL